MPDHNPTSENQLAHETSPYLLQHKHNPVAWRPWGPEALAEAATTNKPVLLSVGYAACHWCHVMAHESFEDRATATVMNELFVNIKVDREERPDIDQIYMTALHHLGEPGGWPLTMFLTPTGEPFWGGTYFPKEANYGKPGFVDVLREVARLFREEPGKIEQNRRALMQRLEARARPEGRTIFGLRELDQIAGRVLPLMDQVNGGLRGEPKFPQTAIFELLWRAGVRGGDDRYFEAIEHTLERICNGGIYDHLGGGFSRYSVDERWLVPHFEKMLYDNAHLLALLAAAWTRNPRELYRTRAQESVVWLAREMTMSEGGFASSLDADSEGEEGKFYVWSHEDVATVLGPDIALFASHYDVTPEGNFEGSNILNRLAALPTTPADESRFAALRARLFAARERRVRPGLDDKVLADWNGMMITALVQAGRAFEEPAWIAHAERAFDFVAENMSRGDRLGHSWREGRLLFPGLASDFAWMIAAALALHEATGSPSHLRQALTWQDSLERHHADAETAVYFLTADDAAGLVIRPRSTVDDAIENHNAVIATNLVRLGTVTRDDRWRARADRLFDALLPHAAENLFGHAAVLNALDFRLRAAEIALVGEGAEADALTRAALLLAAGETIIVRATGNTMPAGHPAHDKTRAMPEAAAFVCSGERCSLPITDPGRLAAAVQAFAPPAP